MKNRLKFTLIAVAAFISMPTITVSGQTNTKAGKYGTDSVKCVQNLSLYRDYYKQKLYNDAYKFWKVAFTICPASSEQMYVDGANLVEYKIKNAGTDEQKAAYIDTLLMVYDQRIKYFGKEGYLLGRKGTDMLRYLPDSVSNTYNVLGKSVELQKESSEAGALLAYFTAAVKLEKEGKLEAEDIVEVFEETNNIISHNLQKYKGQSLEKYYKMSQERISELASPYLSCEVLVKVVNENFEDNRADTAWLERTANIMEMKGCTEGDAFYKLASELHELNPTASSSEKMGITSLKAKKYSQALEYFKEAVELETDQDKKADYYIGLAQTYSGMGQFAASRTNARKAADARPGFGLPYIIIGDLYASSTDCGTDACTQKAIYWLAVDCYTKAKSVDPSVASTANNKIATYSKYFPAKNDCFFVGIKEGNSVEIGCWINESTKARY